MVYVKFVSQHEIEYPPKNKDGIINYDLDIDRLITDGYKEFVNTEDPQTDRLFEMLYRNNTDSVEKYVHWLETEEEYQVRKFAEAKIKKHTENEKSCQLKLNSGRFFVIVDGKSASYLYNDQTKNDLNASAIGFIAGVITEKQWTDEDGNTVMLSQENVAEMLSTLNDFANPVWAKWGDYKKTIDEAQTQEDLDKIIIDYSEV